MEDERQPKRQRPGPKAGIVYEYFAAEGKYNGSSRRMARKCNACGDVIPAPKAKAEELIQHVISRCQGISVEARADFTRRHALELRAKAVVSAREVCDDEDPAPSLSTGSVTASTKGRTATGALSLKQSGKKRSKGQTSILQFTGSTVPKGKEDLTYKKLASFFIMNNLPFELVESPYFLDFLYTLQPTYALPGRLDIERPLAEAYAETILAVQRLMEPENFLTISIGSWTNRWGQSIYGVTVTLGSDRRMFLLGAPDLAACRNTEILMAVTLQQYTRMCGARRITWTVTDGSPACKTVREVLPLALPGYDPLQDMRCHMHAFNLAMQSVLSHEDFASFVGQCQRAVLHTRASQPVMSAVMSEARGLGVSVMPAHVDDPRLTSTARCIRSLRDLFPAYSSTVTNRPELFTSACGRELAAILREPHFGEWCTLVPELLEPFERVSMALQGSDSTLGDVTRYWLHLCIELGVVAVKFQSYLAVHITTAFNLLAKEMLTVTCQLALFLDPRYKGLVAVTPQVMEAMLNEGMRILKRRQVFANDQSEMVERKALRELMVEYAVGMDCFNKDCGPKLNDVRRYWQLLPQGYGNLTHIALMLLSVPPHVSGLERCFGAMGRAPPHDHSRRGEGQVGMMAAVQVFNRQTQSEGRSELARRRGAQQMDCDPPSDEEYDTEWCPVGLEEHLRAIYREQQQDRAPLVMRAAELGMETAAGAAAQASQPAVLTLLREHLRWFDWTKDPLELNPGQKEPSFAVGS